MAGSPKKRARKIITAKAIEGVKKRGRPIGSDSYDPELAEELCNLIIQGVLVKDASIALGLNGYKTIECWRNSHPDFLGKYARARELAADAKAEEALEIAKTLATVREEDTVQAARVRIDTLKWAASTLQPKVYGQQMRVDGDLNLNVSLAGALDLLKGERV